MLSFNKNDILETVRMIDSENLDVRTITMALSLFGCVGRDARETADLIYKKIVNRAGKLVSVGNEIA